MKITKSQLKQIIKESLELEEQEQEQQPAQPAAQPADARQQKVAAATSSGAMLDAEQYAKMLKQVLLTRKVAPQVRKQALEAIFGQRGSAINSIVLQLLKGAQE